MRCRFHFVLLLLGSVIGLAQAQSGANSLGLMGGVQDTSGAVIVGAQVSLTTQDGRIVAQGITDSSGAFRFTNITAGNYSIDVTQAGFQEVKQPIKAGSGAVRRSTSSCQSRR
ncbi:carboxypeptidase-like regulatory domain-containing protein [Tunturiibacter gelidiferens]|uniref:carboxypeptidase-like regulatory domain-containing protein n=1 Tax=Tunturiibacter gelidiferens TaxID=3069689 RepID=UPI003D9B47E9